MRKSPHAPKNKVCYSFYGRSVWRVSYERMWKLLDVWLVGRNVSIRWMKSNWSFDDVWITFRRSGYSRYFGNFIRWELMFAFKNACTTMQSTCYTFNKFYIRRAIKHAVEAHASEYKHSNKYVLPKPKHMQSELQFNVRHTHTLAIACVCAVNECAYQTHLPCSVKIIMKCHIAQC